MVHRKCVVYPEVVPKVAKPKKRLAMALPPVRVAGRGLRSRLAQLMARQFR